MYVHVSIIFLYVILIPYAILYEHLKCQSFQLIFGPHSVQSGWGLALRHF